MGTDGAGPRPFTQRQARTIFLRAPYAEWGAITSGRKTEFRASPNACSQLWSVEPPTPAVVWADFPSRGPKRELMVLEATWREPLGAISAESLEREGHPSFPHFRRYWMKRNKIAFRPTRIVSVYQVRPVIPGDAELLGLVLFERLYGEFV